MEPSFHGLPPQKRFKLQNQVETPEEVTPTPSPTCLPAKKRKESRDSPPFQHLLHDPNTTCNLPAKKRVWALQPLFNSPKKPILSFDLNLAYQQSPEKQTPAPSPEKSKLDIESHENLEEILEEQEEDDDGILCGVCQSTDGNPTDPIVFCDGCNLMVHANCYGNPLVQRIPEGDWFCATCQADSPSTCCLCPVQAGVMKPTIDGKWAHIMCALLVPEVFFRNPDGREDIDCSHVPKKRWEKMCYVCGSRNGCAIECSEPKCGLGFHVGCGLNEDLCIEYREGRQGKGDIVSGFCKTHTDIWEKQQQTGKFKIVAKKGAW